MITLTDGSTTLTFPDGTQWADEFTWTPVVQASERTVAGSLIVDVQTRSGGQPITLKSYDAESGWMKKADVDVIRTWSQIAGKTLTLNLRGVFKTVMFRHEEPPALDVTPVTYYDDPASTDPYVFTLRLLDVTP